MGFIDPVQENIPSLLAYEADVPSLNSFKFRNAFSGMCSPGERCAFICTMIKIWIYTSLWWNVYKMCIVEIKLSKSLLYMLCIFSVIQLLICFYSYLSQGLPCLKNSGERTNCYNFFIHTTLKIMLNKTLLSSTQNHLLSTLNLLHSKHTWKYMAFSPPHCPAYRLSYHLWERQKPVTGLPASSLSSPTFLSRWLPKKIWLRNVCFNPAHGLLHL